MNGTFELQYPAVLSLMALLPVYAVLCGRRGRQSAIQFSSADIARAAGATVRNAAGRWLLFLRLLVAGLLIFAMAGPRITRERTVTSATGVDIMLCLDLSWSMEALDMSVGNERLSRFDIAREQLENFIRERPNDRLGLIAFSAVPYLVSPLTLNHDWLVQNLDRLYVGLIRDLGTAIGDATASAAKRLSMLQGAKSRIIILLTDGDNNAGEIDPVPAAQLAAALGAKVYTIGIGIEKPCSLPQFNPATGKMILDPSGNWIPAMTLQPANYSVLNKMSTLSHAKFYRATNRSELQSIYADIDRLEKTEVKLRKYSDYTPLFQLPLLVALGLLAVEQILAQTRYRRVP